MLEPVTMEECKKKAGHGLHFEKDTVVSTRTWSVSVVDEHEDYRPDITFIVLGAGTIFFACVGVVFWLFTNHRQAKQGC